MVKFLKNCREYITIVIAALVFYYSPALYRQIDATAGAFDLGIIQVPTIAVFLFFVYNFTAWFTINLLWPDLRKFFNAEFSNSFKSLTPWQKVKFSGYVLSCYLVVLVLLSRSM